MLDSFARTKQRRTFGRGVAESRAACEQPEATRCEGGEIAAATMEAKATKQTTHTIDIHTITAMNVATGNRPRQAPAAAATPFPPRNRSQTGKEWPTTTNKAARIPMR